MDIEGSPVCYLPSDFDCFRLERPVAGVGFAPTGSTTPFTAHARSASKGRRPPLLALRAAAGRIFSAEVIQRGEERGRVVSAPVSDRGVRPLSLGKEPLVQGLFSHPPTPLPLKGERGRGEGAFGGFGPAGLVVPGNSPSLTCVPGRKPSALRAHVRLECPRHPGVYGMVDRRGELIYVGKAKCLRARLLGYFRPRSRDPKAGQIIAETRLLAWEVVPTEFSALLRELELIRAGSRASTSRASRSRRRRTLVCLGRRPAPYAYLTRRLTGSVLAAFGPVPDGHTAREAVRRLNDWYGLRDCPQSQKMVFSDQQELFPVLRAAGCLRHEIGTCLGAVAAACSHAAYEARLRRGALLPRRRRPGAAGDPPARHAGGLCGHAVRGAAAVRDQLEALRRAARQSGTASPRPQPVVRLSAAQL